MERFEFINGGVELLDLVGPLWDKLNEHHGNNSNHFSHKFRSLTFEIRKNKLNGDKEINIDLIKDKETGLYIGYCISTVSKDLTGEIDSLFVEKEYRSFGLGDKLMKNSLKWLNDKGVKTKIIGVAEGNESALSFYERYGFYKRRIVLEEK